MPPKKKVKLTEEVAVGDLFKGKFFLVSNSLFSCVSAIQQQGGIAMYKAKVMPLQKLEYLVLAKEDIASSTHMIKTAQHLGSQIVSPQFIETVIASGAIPDNIDEFLVNISTVAPKKAAAKKASSSSSKPFSNVKFAISGTLSKPRKQIEAVIAKLGGSVAGSITNTVDYLITTEEEVENGTAKINDAQEKGIPLLSEDFIWVAEEDGELPDHSNYVIGGDGDEEDDGECEDGEGEDGEEEEEEEDVGCLEAPPLEVEPPYDPEFCDEFELSLDPRLPPLADGAPSELLKLAPEVLKHITHHLRFKHIINLYKTGSTALRDCLSRGGAFDLSVNLRRRINASWPASISYFPGAKIVDIHAPKYYHHMPCSGFDPNTLPKSVTSLSLSFGNSMDLIATSTSPLRSNLLELTKLRLRGDYMQVLIADIEPMACLEGLTHLDCPISISVTQLALLPRSLISLSKIALEEASGPLTIKLDLSLTSALPPNLDHLEIEAGILAGLLLHGIHASPLRHNLRSLVLSCDTGTKAFGQGEFVMSDATLKLLPRSLQCLKIDFNGPNIPDDPEPPISKTNHHLLTRECITSLPDQLETLVLHKTPFLVRGVQFAVLPRSLKTLDLTPVNAEAEDIGLLPATLTDLVLTQRGLKAVEEGRVTDAVVWNRLNENATIAKSCVDLLPPNLTRLALPFSEDMNAKDWQKLPQSLKYLSIAMIDQTKGAKHLPRGLLSFEYIDSYSFIYTITKQLPPGLQSLRSYGMTDWEGDVMIWPKHLKDLIVSCSNFEDEFMSSIPRSLEHYGIEDGDSFEYAHALPRRLASLDIWLQNSTNEQLFDGFPPHLAYLRANLLDVKLKDWARLPRTLGRLVLPKIILNTYSVKDMRAQLPPYCEIIFE